MNKVFINAEWKNFPVPEPGKDEVLLQVKAIGVNRADILQMKGLYPPPPGYPDILGLECAGIVVKTGKNVPENLLGKRVMTLLPAGAYADFVTNHHRLCLPVPQNLSDEEAAAVPEALFTAYLNLVFLAKVQPEENVLVYGAAGGIGSTLIQLIAYYQANPIAVVGSREKKEFIEKLGATQVFLRSDPDFSSKIFNKLTNKVDIIWDIVGNQSTASLNLKLANKYARWLLIGLLGKNNRWELPTAKILTKNLTIIGSTLRNRPLELKIKLAEKIKEELLPAYESGNLKPVLYKTFPRENVSEAFRYLLENKVLGKIILK